MTSVFQQKTYTWQGGTTGATTDPNSYEINGGTATTTPQPGDLLIVPAGSLVAFPLDQALTSDSSSSTGFTLAVGGIASAGTVSFTGDSTVTENQPTVDGNSLITNAVPGASGALFSTLESFGTFVNQGTVEATAASGSQFTIDVNADGGAAGYFINASQMAVAAGNTLTIAMGNDAEFLNTGVIFDQGGSLDIVAQSGATPLNGGLQAMDGVFTLSQGGQVEVGTPLTTANGGSPSFFAFLDASNARLKIDHIGAFSGGRILGFAAGDTIDIGTTADVTGISYAANGVLTLDGASGVIGSIQFPSGIFTGSGGSITNGVGTLGSFVFSHDATTGDTLITTTATNDVFTSASGALSFGDAANWSSSTVPGAASSAVIGNGSRITQMITTGSAALTVGSLMLVDQNATLDIQDQFTLGSSPGVLQDVVGTVQIESGATLTAAELRVTGGGSAKVNLFGSLDLTGFVASTGNDAAFLTGSDVIDGGILNAGSNSSQVGGLIAIGQDGSDTPAQLLVDGGASVTDTYAYLASGPTSYGALTVTGVGTNWNDTESSVEHGSTRGYMMVGNNDLPSSPPYLGAAQLTVSESATVTEASYAQIGASANSAGSVTVDTGAVWSIGNSAGEVGFLNVGNFGAGSLLISNADGSTVANGGTVLVGGGGTVTVNGTVQTVNFAIDIGHHSGSTGSVTVTGSGSYLQAENAVVVGDQGSGTLDIQNGGTVHAVYNLNIGGSSTAAAGGIGTLSVTGSGTLQVGTHLDVWAQSTLSVDNASGVMIGTGASYGAGNIDIATAGTLYGDGLVSAAGTIVNDGTIAATNNGNFSSSTGGTLELAASLGGSGQVDIATGTTLKLDGAIVGTAQTITFGAGTGMTLILGTPGSSYSGAINELADFDRIEFANGTQITGATLTNGNTITLSTLAGGISGQYAFTDVSFAAGTTTSFVTGTDSNTGNSYVQVFCLAEGTAIATETGEVAIEALEIGTRLPTLIGGSAEPVAWIGRRTVDCASHPRPQEVWPVRIAPGSFGPGLPHRPLLLSPDHAVLVEGVLIPVKYLIDDVCIVQVPVASITYYHVELAHHDVVLAEGLPVETYLDVGERDRFENAGAVTRLFPDFASVRRDGHGCAPLVIAGPQLDAARARLGAWPLGGRATPADAAAA